MFTLILGLSLNEYDDAHLRMLSKSSFSSKESSYEKQISYRRFLYHKTNV